MLYRNIIIIIIFKPKYIYCFARRRPCYKSRKLADLRKKDHTILRSLLKPLTLFKTLPDSSCAHFANAPLGQTKYSRSLIEVNE